MTDPSRPFSLRSAILPVYLPTLLFAAGESAIIPIIPVIAGSVGATLAVAGLVAAMLTVGIVMGDIPSGWIVSRIGERNAMLWASLLALIGVMVCLIAPNPSVLGLGILMIGLATAVFALARHAFLTSYVPLAYRARSLSTLGGMFRAGGVIGPLLSAGLIAWTGSAQSAFWLTVAFTVATTATLLFLPDPEATFGSVRRVETRRGFSQTEGEVEAEAEALGLWGMIFSSRKVLVRLGSAAAIVGALRAGRTVILPLWALSIGLRDSDTALIIGIASALDFALFFASGQIMDRWGRLWSGLPSLITMGTGLIVLSFTHNLPTAVPWFIVVAFTLAIGNGVGSGILLTLGSDLAPPENPAPFLGAFRFTTDTGAALAPLGVAAITAAASLSLAAGLVGGLGFIGAFLLLRYVPKYLPRTP
jgi:MFS family permease